MLRAPAVVFQWTMDAADAAVARAAGDAAAATEAITTVVSAAGLADGS